MGIATRLTERLGIAHPILSAPMALAAGGRLASAVSRAGGLGLIGGGYGDADWLTREFDAAGNVAVGCGFITWSLARQPALLDHALERAPKAVMLSFGDASPFVARIRETGAIVILQVQTLEQATAAIDLGADIVVAQGTEAGGHGGRRATFTLVPEIADLAARRRSETLVVAAGGVADGRGLAAALMLGADGVLVGSRFWASDEAMVHPNAHQAALAATGDATLRTSVFDIARRLDWPAHYTIRTLANQFSADWHGRETELAAVADTEAARYNLAREAGDQSVAATIVGEAVGLIRDRPGAEELVERIVSEATDWLGRAGGFVRL